MTKRRQTSQFMLGNVGIGSEHPVTVQSMTTTKTRDTEKTLEQIYEIASNGADIVRVTCNEIEAAESLVKICARSPVPIVADIHFQYKLALAAIEAGVQGLRLNPGNIRNEKQIKEDSNLIVIQINGKKRGLITTDSSSSETEIIKMVYKDQKIAKYLVNNKIKKQIYIKNKLINIII